METPGLRDRLRYGFDNWMARGTVAIMGLLALATVGFVVVVAAVAVVLRVFPDDAEDGDFWDIVWGNLMRTLDPGTMGGDTGWGFRLLMLLVTIGGLVIVASLIGIVSGAFDDKMIQLRKGRSLVLETDHTLILGWSPQLFLIVGELCRANASRKRATIVILADRDKVEMEDELRERVPDTGRTTIVCRSGDPTSPSDIRIVSPLAARSVIILTGEAPDPDAAALKTALALTHALPDGAPGARIVAALDSPANLDAARTVGRDSAQWLLASTLVRRLTAQTCRQSGLSTVYSELLDFDGDEIYFVDQPTPAGSTYLDAQAGFADSAVIGLVRQDRPLLNPAPTTELEPQDRLVVISADDSGIVPAPPGAPDPDAISGAMAPAPRPERTLVLGYNAGIGELLAELARYTPPGSSATVVADVPDPGVVSPPGMAVGFRRADTTSRPVLESLDVAGHDHILVLADGHLHDAQAADARTLVTLLHLREIADRTGKRLSIVSEMRDDGNRELAEVTRADDFIVSDRLVGLLLAQVSENPGLAEVFDTLFSSHGCEIYLRPAGLYLKPGVETDFYTVLAAAAARGETAIGYRVGAEAHSRRRNYGVHLNPHKPDRLRLGEDDAVIVLADDEK